MLLVALPTKEEPLLPLTYTVKEGVYRESLSGKTVLRFSSVALPCATDLAYTPANGQKVAKGEAVATEYPSSAKETLSAIKEKEYALSLVLAKPLVTKALLLSQTVQWRNSAPQEQQKAEEELLFLLEAYRLNTKQTAENIRQDIAKLKNELPSPLAEGYAPRDGYYFASSDGLEEVWDGEVLSQLSAEEVLARLSLAPRQTENARLLCDFEAEAVMLLPARELGKLEKDKTYAMTLADGTSLSARLSYTDLSAEGETGVAVFRADIVPAARLPLRIQDATLLLREESLLRVPKATVLKAEGQAYVLVRHGERVLARGVEIAHETERFCWLAPLSGKVTVGGEVCLSLRSYEAVLLLPHLYRHKEILEK